MKSVLLCASLFLTPISSSNVTFYLFTQQDNGYVQIGTNNASDYVTNQTIAFVAHGWNENSTAAWVLDLKDALLSRKVPYVITVDYAKAAQQQYCPAFKNHTQIGLQVGRFVAGLGKTVALPNMHLIGHSLGAQVLSLAGKYVFNSTSRRVGRITGLDPAGPFFDGYSPSKHLTPDDANIVFVIHTDMTFLGYYAPCGTTDVFPNGGTNQTGCDSTRDIMCNHHRSYELYGFAVAHPGRLFAARCCSYEDFENGECKDNSMIDLGDLGTTRRGRFYLTTKAKAPYRVLP